MGKKTAKEAQKNVQTVGNSDSENIQTFEYSDSENIQTFEYSDSENVQTLAHSEELERNALVKRLEGELPYSLAGRIQQGKWLLKQEVGIKFAIGCILLEIQAKESFQTFGKTAYEDFGLSKSSLYNYMTFAKKCIALPKLKVFAEENWSKAIALFDSVEGDEELKEIEAQGLDGQGLEEYDGMSVRDFKALIKRLKTRQEELVDKEVRQVKKDNKLLTQQVIELKAREKRSPSDENIDWLFNYVPVLEVLIEQVEAELGRFAFDPRMLTDDRAQACLEGMYQRIQARLQIFDERWQGYTGHSLEQGETVAASFSLRGGKGK